MKKLWMEFVARWPCSCRLADRKLPYEKLFFLMAMYVL